MSDNAQDNATATTADEAEVTGEAAEAPEASEANAEAGTETTEVEELEETKRKFRAALERKHQANTRDGGSAGGRGTVKGKGAQGPAASRRSFRRKSG